MLLCLPCKRPLLGSRWEAGPDLHLPAGHQGSLQPQGLHTALLQCGRGTSSACGTGPGEGRCPAHPALHSQALPSLAPRRLSIALQEGRDRWVSARNHSSKAFPPVGPLSWPHPPGQTHSQPASEQGRSAACARTARGQGLTQGRGQRARLLLQWQLLGALSRAAGRPARPPVMWLCCLRSVEAQGWVGG